MLTKRKFELRIRSGYCPDYVEVQSTKSKIFIIGLEVYGHMPSKIEPLGKKHDRVAFSCGDDALDTYLKKN
jgi:hypothetical protein